MSEDLTKKLRDGGTDQIASILKNIFLRISVINDNLLTTRADLVAVKERLHELEQNQTNPTNSQT